MADFAWSDLLTYLTSDGSLASFSSGPEVQSSPDTDDGFYNVGDDLNEVVGYIYAGSFTLNGHEFLVFDRLPGDSTLLMSATAAESDFPATYQDGDFVLDTTPCALCFAEGMLIATEQGETPVEQLQIGDLLRGKDGTLVHVKWIGRQTLNKFFSGPNMQMVRIRAGALGGGLPHTDLTVTADHGMVIDGLVINASALINGTTIDWVPMAELGDTFTVYHVETENHDVILANGAPSETFIDYRDRAAFDIHQEYLDLYGAERIIPELPMPRISTARLVPDAVRSKLSKGAPAETMAKSA